MNIPRWRGGAEGDGGGQAATAFDSNAVRPENFVNGRDFITFYKSVHLSFVWQKGVFVQDF